MTDEEKTREQLLEELNQARRELSEATDSRSRDMTERKRKEMNAHFLARLDSEIRRLRNAEAIIEVTTRMLGEHLNASRCLISEIDRQADSTRIQHQWCRTGVSEIPERHRFRDFAGPELRNAVLSGESISVSDVRADRRTEAFFKNYIRLGIASFATVRYMRGELHASLSVNSHTPRQWREDEVALLGEVAARVMPLIEHARVLQSLRESEERFRIALQKSPIFIGQLNAELKFTWIYNLPQECQGEEILGKKFEDLIPQQDASEQIAVMMRVLEKGISERFEIAGRTDEKVWVYDATVEPLKDHSGKIVGLTIAAMDITERKYAEEEVKRVRDELKVRVAERTAELEKSNQALQEFTSIASHDMQEPLRKIIAFGEKLQKSSGSLDDVGRDCLGRMQNAALRMRSLLNSLLDYSRVTSKKEPFQPVDLGRLIPEVLEDLEARIIQTDARVELDGLPVVIGDSNQMRQLFQNLIGNSLKYHGKEKPRIKVHANLHKGKKWQIFIEDNGIGFDEKHLNRIFQPFQRLHGRASPYDGAGMGLAICRKIVERHGGTITAKSKPGEGATFIVTFHAMPIRSESASASVELKI